MHHEKPPLNTTIINDHGCRALTEAGRPVFLHVSAWPGTRLLGTSLNSGSGMWRVTRSFVCLIPVKSIPTRPLPWPVCRNLGMGEVSLWVLLLRVLRARLVTSAMDVRRALRNFVEQGRDLYQRLHSSEGDAVSPDDLHLLEVQLYLLDKEVARRKAVNSVSNEE